MGEQLWMESRAALLFQASISWYSAKVVRDLFRNGADIESKFGPITNVPSPPSVIDFNYVSTFGRVTPAYRTEFRITGPNFFPPERSLSGSKRRGGKLSFEFANPLCTEIYSLRGSPTVLRILFVVHILGARGMYPFKKKERKVAILRFFHPPCGNFHIVFPRFELRYYEKRWSNFVFEVIHPLLFLISVSNYYFYKGMFRIRRV